MFSRNAVVRSCETFYPFHHRSATLCEPSEVTFSIVAQGNVVEGFVQLPCTADIKRTITGKFTQGVRTFAVLKLVGIDPSNQRAYESTKGFIRST